MLVDVASAAECSATQGTFATQKLAMHALILLATSESTENHKEILTEMVGRGIVPVAVVAMKADDEEAVYVKRAHAYTHARTCACACTCTPVYQPPGVCSSTLVVVFLTSTALLRFIVCVY